ncbi:hypothetical protein [Nonomuraea sp. NPDC050202]|uniref:hypothetical protein n=1 Tax=unclassified Nonomuraea TaxID=2593643 RepID=UPI0033C79812
MNPRLAIISGVWTVPLVTIASPSDDSVRVSRGFAGRQADRVRRGAASSIATPCPLADLP